MARPVCKLLNRDGNVFNIIGNVTRTLKNAGMPDDANEFQAKAFKCKSYDEVLRLVMEYVEVE